MMKKVLLTAGALVLAAGIVSCGNPNPTETPTDTPTETPTEQPTVTPGGKTDVTIKVWGPDAESPIIDWAVAEYNAREDGKYNVTHTFESVGEDKVDTEMTKNVAEGATLYFYADDKAINLMKINAVSYLVGDNAAYIEDNFGDPALDSVTMNNKYVGYPVQNDNLWFANYDNQYLTSDDVRSLETVLAKAEAQGKKVSLPIDTGWYVIPSFYSMVELYWTLDDNNVGHFTTDLDKPEAAAAAAYLNNLFVGYMKKGILEIGQNLGGESGSIYTWNGAWNYDSYCDNVGEENLTLTTVPSYNVDGTDIQCKTFIGSKILSVNGSHTPEQVEAAHEIAQILVGKEGSLRRYEARNSIPANLEALEDERYTGNLKPTVIAIQNQAAMGGYAQAATVQGSEIWGIMGDALGKGLAGTTDANDEVTGLIPDWAAFLAEQAGRIRELTF